MTMAAKGLAKLIEECGELLQVAGKRLAYYTTDEHPDGGAPLSERLEDEIADVMAACGIVIDAHELDHDRIHARILAKRELFTRWDEDATNNRHGIDASSEAHDPDKGCSDCSNADPNASKCGAAPPDADAFDDRGPGHLKVAHWYYAPGWCPLRATIK